MSCEALPAILVLLFLLSGPILRAIGAAAADKRRQSDLQQTQRTEHERQMERLREEAAAEESRLRRLRGAIADEGTSSVQQRERVVERKVLVTRCEHCGAVTPVDHPRCRDCGRDLGAG